MEATPDIRSLIRALHAANAASGRRLVLFVAGGGMVGVAALLSEAGASASILEARAPYAREAVTATLGGTQLASYASRAAALELARAALSHARAILTAASEGGSGSGGGGDGPPLSGVGIGAAGALASVPTRRGEHRIALARADGHGESVVEIIFGHGARGRSEEEALAGAALVGFASSCGAAAGLNAASATQTGLVGFGAVEGDSIGTESHAPLLPPLEALLGVASRDAGTVGAGASVTHIVYAPNGSMTANTNIPTGALLLSGSFNPPHHGHRKLLAAAAARLSADRGGAAVWSAFELSAENVDKPPLTLTDVEQRVAWLRAGGEGAGAGAGARARATPSPLPHVLVTRAPLFSQKAALFPGASFAMGYDTAARLVEPHYYVGGLVGMTAALARLRDTGSRVYVAGRVAPGAGFLTLEKDLLPRVPKSLWSLFEQVPEEECRADISSSLIRQEASKTASEN